MKTLSSLSALTLSALLLAGSAYAGGEHPDHDLQKLVVASNPAEQNPSYGSAISAGSADRTILLKVQPDGSVSPSTLSIARDENVDFYVNNTSAQPVRVSIDGEGATAANIGQIAAGQRGEFAWHFDIWKAQPKVLKIGQTNVKLYVIAPHNQN